MRNQRTIAPSSSNNFLTREDSTMQNLQINHKATDINVEHALAQFLKVEADVVKNLRQIEQKALQGKSLSNAQDFLRQLCTRGFFIDDISRETNIELSALQGLFSLSRRELEKDDFSSLLFFYCAVECGYLSPESLARANTGTH